MRWTAVAVLAGCFIPLYAAPPAHAAPRAPAAPQAPANCRPPAGQLSGQAVAQGGEPWAQQVLNIESAHEKATGKGVKVAVVDSGVTATNPQLAGQLAKGADLTDTGAADCLGHGTWVAGIIAAKAGVSPFVGVAPDAKIIPIKFAAKANNVDSGLAATGINEAVKLGADVINVSTQSLGDDPRLRSAVRNALAKGVVVVAAAGNIDLENGKTPGLMYPSAYEGVISVGAVGQDGQVTKFSNPDTPVHVVAPGQEIITTAPDGNYAVAAKGTSFAAPFVAGLAALILEVYPNATPQQVRQRIMATAGGNKGAGSGQGMISPFEALTAVNPGTASGGGTGAAAPVRIAMPDRPDPATKAVALGVAGGAVGAAVLVLAGGLLIPLGRRRGWRAGPGQPPAEGPDESA